MAAKIENAEIRSRIETSGLRYWQVAAAIGINRVTLCEWLRFPLAGKRLEAVQLAIQSLTEGGESND